MRVRTNGVSLNVVAAGAADRPLVLLLHGFPEFWYAWRHQLGALAAAGFHVLAPDQRGYNLSDKPADVRAYDLDLLAADVIGLADALAVRSFRLVGHDWGGVVAWWIAARHPDRVERLVVLNAPHPGVMRPYLASHPRQLARSSYAAFFQLPSVPEALLGAGRFWALRRTLLATSRPSAFSPADIERYVEAWSRPGALTAMLNWYRAAGRRRSAAARTARIQAPTLVIWGGREAFLELGLAQASLSLCDRGQLMVLAGATHWIQHEEPKAVNAALIDFLTPVDGTLAVMPDSGSSRESHAPAP